MVHSIRWTRGGDLRVWQSSRGFWDKWFGCRKFETARSDIGWGRVVRDVLGVFDELYGLAKKRGRAG